jgi:hypothetical protein
MPSAKKPPNALPTREEELELHRRLIDGDHTASVDLALAIFVPLVDWLRARNRAVEEAMCGEAAAEAFCALAKNPGSYKPQSDKAVGLFQFLQMSAMGDLKNLLRKESRHHRLRVSWESVEELPDAGKYLGREHDMTAQLQIKEEVEVARVLVLPLVRDGLTEKEVGALDLLLEGEKKTAAFAGVLGICHLPSQEQEAEVKRVKDKLNKRIQRARAGYEQSS